MRDTTKINGTPLFRTLVSCDKCTTKVLPNTISLFIGSCFTQNIGHKFAECGLKVSLNPFGIVYNPISIGLQLTRLINNQNYKLDELRFHNGLYHTFDHHSQFSDVDPASALNKINTAFEEGVTALKNGSFLFLTFGSAFVYCLLESKSPVANCHKYPSKFFKKRLLEVNEVVESFDMVLKSLFKLNPSLKIVLSVSPIRHLSDGFVENNVSKSTLLLAVSKIVERNSQSFYFPAFEIVLDELRDYRFFSEDMVHPSQTAVDYIWQRVIDSFMDDSTCLMIDESERLKRDLSHRPFNPEGEEYKRFLKGVKERVIVFKNKYPENLLFDTILSI